MNHMGAGRLSLCSTLMIPIHHEQKAEQAGFWIPGPEFWLRAGQLVPNFPDVFLILFSENEFAPQKTDVWIK